jgi:alginate O-acetyltransferase complex protein AlgI
MNFVSWHFGIFLAVVLAGFYALPGRWRTHWLLAASYFFYGYWSVKYLLLLVATMLIDFFFAQLIADSRTEKGRKYFLVSSLLLNLGILFVFKYFNFVMDLIFDVTHHRLAASSLILPFGISFYTFHSISYVVDVYRRVIPAERRFISYSAYVMFFPQLVAGPIARASHLLHQFAEPKRFNPEQWTRGLWFISCGYFMKVVLADNLAPAVDLFLGQHVGDVIARTPLEVAQGIYFFAFQIYFDFAGYTSIAIGVAKLFDYELVKNFDRPYIAQSITEFWRRWHISLSTWLRDYLYIGLGGNRQGRLKTYRNLMLTMLLGGLWHGANITFVIWGGLHGFYLVIEKLLRANPVASALCRKIPAPVRILITFHLVCVAWIFFRMPDLHSAGETLRYFATWLSNPLKYTYAAGVQRYLWALILGWLVFEMLEARLNLRERFVELPIGGKVVTVYGVVAAILLFAQTNPQAFIYFQF